MNTATPRVPPSPKKCLTSQEKLHAVLAAYSWGKRQAVDPANGRHQPSKLALRAVSKSWGIASTRSLVMWASKLKDAAPHLFSRKNSNDSNLIERLETENRRLKRKLRRVRAIIKA